MSAISIRALTRSFGRKRALDGLDLEVPRGSVFGFVGPNGAGKTTTIRILLGLARADSGRATVLGEDVLARPGSVAARLGFLPDVPSFYPWMRAHEYLAFCAAAYRVDPAARERRVKLLLDLVDLAGAESTIAGFSRGMKQRLGIAQALINSPELLILDEPTSALDPVGRHDLLSLIERLRGQTTVFFSSHILGDVERVCSEIAVVDSGRVVASGHTSSLLEQYAGPQRIRIALSEPDADLPGALESEQWAGRVTRVEDGSWMVNITDFAAAAHRIPMIVSTGEWGLRAMEIVSPTLEDVFVQIVGRRAS